MRNQFDNIIFLGDIHGRFDQLQSLCSQFGENDLVIQVGDFGVSNKMHLAREILGNLKPFVYFIDGNHENFDVIAKWTNTPAHQVYERLFYIPRGTVMDINGMKFGFLGGAESIDRNYRVAGLSWWDEERILQSDLDRLYANVDNKHLDVLVTHAPPISVVQARFSVLNKVDWGLDSDWRDESSIKVQEAYDRCKPGKLICGHMHRHVLHDNVRILDIDELYQLVY